MSLGGESDPNEIDYESLIPYTNSKPKNKAYFTYKIFETIKICSLPEYWKILANYLRESDNSNLEESICIEMIKNSIETLKYTMENELFDFLENVLFCIYVMSKNLSNPLLTLHQLNSVIYFYVLLDSDIPKSILYIDIDIINILINMAHKATFDKKNSIISEIAYKLIELLNMDDTVVVLCSLEILNECIISGALHEEVISLIMDKYFDFLTAESQYSPKILINLEQLLKTDELFVHCIPDRVLKFLISYLQNTEDSKISHLISVLSYFTVNEAVTRKMFDCNVSDYLFDIFKSCSSDIVRYKCLSFLSRLSTCDHSIAHSFFNNVCLSQDTLYKLPHKSKSDLMNMFLIDIQSEMAELSESTNNLTSILVPFFLETDDYTIIKRILKLFPKIISIGLLSDNMYELLLSLKTTDDEEIVEMIDGILQIYCLQNKENLFLTA